MDLGNAAVVKFERRQDATNKGKAESGEFFVVDVWKKDGDAWKLANRFVSKTGSELLDNSSQANRKTVSCFYDRLASSNNVRSRSASSREASVTM